jgi:hypothetical protein
MGAVGWGAAVGLSAAAVVAFRLPHYFATFAAPTWLGGAPVSCSGFVLGVHIAASLLFVAATAWALAADDRRLGTFVGPAFVLIASAWAISAVPHEHQPRGRHVGINAALTAVLLLPLAVHPEDEARAVALYKVVGAALSLLAVGVTLRG